MKELFETAIVEKRNILNELRANNMSLQELRFFSIYLSKINPFDLETRIVRFPLNDFRRIMGIGSDMNMTHFRQKLRNIMQQLVEIPNENGYGYRTITLFKEADVSKDETGEWYVAFDANDKALPLMFEFKDKYFSYELWNALRLKSKNQMRMYEILKQYEKVGRRELTVEELRSLLGIDPKDYSGRTGWSDFKSKVLDSCQQALKQTTDICYTYDRGQSGRGGKWLSIVFTIQKNTEYVNPLSLDGFINMNSDDEMGSNKDSAETNFVFNGKEPVNIYQNERLSFLAGACDDEFNETEMEHIFKLICPKSLPEHQMGTEFARYDYLSEMFSKMNVYADKNKITDRYAYICKMIENDDRY
ncbi:replication initiation protein [Ruminococcus sp.]|uniref:replication initiation protein n=1 Tax=Ruminococcus sp. TaxID=41978 RepID=UPI001B59FA06|nr:replication initiation protein [Ruminococcus sp.]MBP5433769.1 replication initiation protein [Ruminococcus sp.]